MKENPKKVAKEYPYFWWLVVNEYDEPLYLEADGKLWVFKSSADAQRYIDSPLRDSDRKLKKVRRLCRVMVEEKENL